MQTQTAHFQFFMPKGIRPDLPLFVYFPGMDGTGKLLRSQIEKGLDRAFDLRCLVMPPDDLSTWDRLAQKVVALLRAELRGHRTRSVYWCGESFGGCLALKAIRLAPELCDRLILINPASCFMAHPWIHWGSQVTGWLPPPMYAMSVVGLLPFLASLGHIARPERNDLLAAMQSVPQQTSTWRVSLLREFEIASEQLAQIHQPVLAIASRGDRLLPSVAEANRFTHFMPQATAAILPHSGHACLLETDVNLYQILKDRDFLPNPETIATAV